MVRALSSINSIVFSLALIAVVLAAGLAVPPPLTLMQKPDDAINTKFKF
jgi:hypothetical protein